MTPIITPLQLDDRKSEVANLQEGLLLLIDRQLLAIPPDQLVRTISDLRTHPRTRSTDLCPVYFNHRPNIPTTTRAQFHLHISGKLDEETANSATQLAA